jgi:hypothetical protein
MERLLSKVLHLQQTVIHVHQAVLAWVGFKLYALGDPTLLLAKARALPALPVVRVLKVPVVQLHVHQVNPL